MEPFLGEIRGFAAGFPPRGWALCDGELLPIQSNEPLFSLLGTLYGGDGRKTFGLPDMCRQPGFIGPQPRAPEPVPVNWIICLEGSYPEPAESGEGQKEEQQDELKK